ncbi:MAG: cob(I)yrinic acid a,c-diamide adenosyltransferase [Candidatus Doudnabacteria bacterium]|nr:cob(I)yrinic acid a,c-diamide adenosyltransferase [Candidatus Doudnabacteria bacterium]
MKNKISITTKTGDRGESGLANGQRLGKDSAVFEVIGNLDEVNSWLGLVAAKLGEAFAPHKQFLYQVQDTLFYIGAEIARSPKAKLQVQAVKDLEHQQALLTKELEDNWHTKFLLPGGTELGGYLDVARTVARRAERSTLAYHRQEPVSDIVIQYLNRLSDYLYLLRCFVNQQEQYTEKEFEAQAESSYLEKVKPQFKKRN